MEEALTYEEKLLTEPVKYYMENKGKNIRQYITNYVGNCLGVDNKCIVEIIEIINIIHNASLVIDDIQDNSLLRRKQECAHIKYGIPLSINAGYLYIFKILNQINKREDIAENTRHKIIENMYLAHIGQGMDIYYTQHKIIPNIESYNKMIYYKTGTFLHIILDLMIGVSKNVILKKKVFRITRGFIQFCFILSNKR